MSELRFANLTVRLHKRDRVDLATALEDPTNKSRYDKLLSWFRKAELDDMKKIAWPRAYFYPTVIDDSDG